MKKTIKLLMIAICIAASLGLVACASTQDRESTGQYLDSSVVTTKVKTAIARKIGVRSITGVEVSTYKGVVQLSGFVDSQTKINQAVAAAKTVRGVVAVENSLLVKKNLK